MPAVVPRLPRLLAAAAAVLAIGAGAAPAQAAIVSKSGTTLNFTAGTGEVNTVTIERIASIFRIIDSGAPVTAGAGCEQVTAHRVRCDNTGITLVRVAAGDLDDSVVFTGPTNTDLRGGPGGDLLTSGSGADTLDAGSGPQWISSTYEYLTAGGGEDVLKGSASLATTTYMDAGPGQDELRGGPGTDYMTGGPGPDDYTGGGASDEVRYFTTFNVTVTPDNVANDGVFGEKDNVRSDIRGVRGGSGNDKLTGSAVDNFLDGGNGDDVLNGMDGDDTIYGGAGLDTINGGEDDDYVLPGTEADVVSGGGGGNDVAAYTDHGTTGVTVSLDGAANDGSTGEGDNVKSDVENLFGTGGSDTLTGNAARNHIEAAGGADTVNGRAGDDELFGDLPYPSSDGGIDTLNGELGNDTLVGGGEADVFNGGDGIDIVSYAERSAKVTASINGIAQDGEAGEQDSIKADIEGINGGTGADVLTGDAKSNTLAGGPGGDTVNGGGGDDLLAGDETGYGFGSDVLNGGDGIDTVTYSAHFSVTATIDGVADDGHTGESDNVKPDVENILGTTGADSLTGSNLANALYGGPGFVADQLTGLGGSDYLSGGPGGDTLKGGAGTDDINARDDAGGDSVSCGTQVDRAIHDSGDAVDPDCEFAAVASSASSAARARSAGLRAQRLDRLVRRMPDPRRP